MCALHEHTQTEGSAENKKSSFHYPFGVSRLGFRNSHEKKEASRRGLLSDTAVILWDTEANMTA